MPRTKLIVSALALALAGASAAQAQTFTGVVSFGDSLSDAGNYVGLIPGAQGSFTTNPDDVWTQLVAQGLGLTQTASRAGGTDFAWGGAPTSNTVPGATVPLGCVPTTLPCRTVAQQIAAYGAVDPNALYTYWAGANDLFNYVGYAGAGFITSAQAQSFVGASAQNAIRQIAGLQAAGARTIVVMNLPDIGRTPNFTNATLFPTQASPANAASLSGLSFVYNSTLNAGLATLADGIVPINVYGLFNELLADPAAYGFSNTNATACNLALTGGSSLFCSPPAYVSPTAADTYMFADGVHPSGASHEMLANVVLATLSAPGQVSIAAELPLQVYDNHSNVINHRIFGSESDARAADESNVYGHVQFSQQDFSAGANTGAFDSNLFTGTFGADVRYSNRISLGAALSFGGSNGDSSGAAIDAKEVLVSAYGVAHFGAGYVNAILSGGSSQFDIDRSIVLGPTIRVESGSTSASHVAAELGGGFTFGSDSLRHGPFASLTWQKIDVDGYAEDSLDSTSMYFSDFNRKSTVARLGYQLAVDAGSFQPFARVAWANDQQERATAVQAGSNTMNGHFTLDGFQGPSDWAEADVGFDYALNDTTSLYFAYRARFNDDTQDSNSGNLGVRMEF